MKITSAQGMGRRPYQEDRFVIIEDGQRVLIATFDGHGGTKTVDILASELPELYERYKDRSGPDLLNTLYTSLDERTKDCIDGSTASMALITPEDIVLAVLGDSPIQVLTKGGEFVMPEHNVRTNAYEVMNVQQRGGVIYGGYAFDPMLGYNTGLQMSRVFGDTLLRRITSQIPEIKVLKREDVTSLLVGTDGLTDPGHMTNPFVLSKQVTAEELIDRYKGGFDNLTAVVVQF